MPNLTDELSMAKEQCMNQFAMAVLVRCFKSIWYDKSLAESVKLLLNLTQAQHKVLHLEQMSRQCHSKVELFQLGLASEPGLRLLRFLNRFLFIKINKVFVIGGCGLFWAYFWYCMHNML